MNRSRWTLPALAGLVAAVFAQGSAMADLPDAGTRIVNQATVQYVDANNTARETTTNEVVLFVRPVYAANLSEDQSRFAAAGAEVRFSHTLTNIGNIANTYCVSAAQMSGDSTNFDEISVVLDTNNDGVADANETILFELSSGNAVTFALPRDARASLLAIGTVPTGATVGQTIGLDLTVSSQNDTGVCGTGVPTDTGADADGTDGTNRDVVTITDQAVLELNKGSTYVEGAVGDLTDDTIEYVLTLRNTGSQDATDILVTDILPSSVTFNAFGTHSGTPVPSPSHVSGTISATIATLAAGDEIAIRFTVDVDDQLGFAGEARTIENTATVEGNLDGIAGREPAVDSNTVSDTAPVITDVRLSDTGTGLSAGVNNGGDDDGTVNDTQLVDVAGPGQTALFDLVVTNTGNVTDTFNLTEASSSGWLASAALSFVGSDGATPLLDTTSDGIPDTGPLAPGESISFRVRAALTTTVPSGPHSAGLVATSTWPVPSSVTPASDPAALLIGGVLTPAVDIANSASATGFDDNGSVNADPASTLTTTLTAAPNSSATFDLFIANEGGGNDTFALSAAASMDGTAALPAGWSVAFMALDGKVLTTTPSLGGGETFAFKAIVNVPASATDGALQSIYFIANSTLTGATDVKQDGVQVSGAPSILLTPEGNGQVAVCANTDYLHTLRNTGGTSETVRISLVSQSQLSSQIRLPSSVSGTSPAAFTAIPLLSTSDTVAVLSGGVWVTRPLVNDGAGSVAVTLAPGEETRIEVRVSASCSAAPGLVDMLILKAESLDLDAASTITDTTRVGATMLSIRKYGALDAECAGTVPTSFDDARVLAQPGDCVVWQIRIENTGAEPVCDVQALDAAPAFTQMSSAPTIFAEPAPGTGACTVNGRDFACTIGNPLDLDDDGNDESFCMKGGEKAEVRFSVEID